MRSAAKNHGDTHERRNCQHSNYSVNFISAEHRSFLGSFSFTMLPPQTDQAFVFGISPSIRATCCTSLSPRPLRLTKTILSLGRALARLMPCTRA